MAAAASAAGHDRVSAAKLVAELVQTGSMEIYDGGTTAVPEADRLDFVCEVISELENCAGAANLRVFAEAYDRVVATAAAMPDPDDLARVCKHAVTVATAEITSGRTLELLPKLLSVISRPEHLDADDTSFRKPLLFSRANALNILAKNSWSHQFVSHAAAMFLDIPMADDQMKQVVTMLLNALPTLEPDEMPPLVYQLLLLAAKGQRNLVIRGIISAIDDVDAHIESEISAAAVSANHGDDDETESAMWGSQRITVESPASVPSAGKMQGVKGTVLLHIAHGAKQDQELGREILKLTKATPDLSPFATAVALSIASIHRFEDAVFDLLKARIVDHFREQQRLMSSRWIRDSITSTHDFAAMVLATADCSGRSWDLVTYGLVRVGTILMDSCKYDLTMPEAPAHRACLLGSSVLEKMYTEHDVLRGEILTEILSRITTRAAGSVEQYLALLSRLSESAPHTLVEHQQQVRETFDYLAFLAHDVAVGLMQAVQPLLAASATARDALMLVLRKALFNREPNSRQVAASGLLLLLNTIRFPAGKASASAEALALEICSTLKRCMTQQATVRRILYTGLLDFASREGNPLRPAVYSVLQTHFLEFVNPESESAVPFNLDRCVPGDFARTDLFEPFSELFCCTWELQRNIGDAASIVVTEKVFKSLARGLGRAHIDSDFSLDKSVHFETEDGVVPSGIIRAQILHRTYAVAIDFLLASGSFKTEDCSNAIAIFKRMRMLEDLLCECKAANVIPSNAGLRLSTATTVSKALQSSEDAELQSGLHLLRNNPAFIRFVFRACATHAAEVALLPGGLNCNTLLVKDRSNLTTIASVVVCELQAAEDCTSKLQKEPAAAGDKKDKKPDKKERGRSLESSLLEFLSKLTDAANKGGSKKRSTSLIWSSIVPTDGEGGSSVSSACTWLFDRFQAFAQAHRFKEAATILDIVGTVYRGTGSGDDARSAVRVWVDRTARDWGEATDGELVKLQAPVCKSLLSLLMDMESDDPNLEAAEAVAADCHHFHYIENTTLDQDSQDTSQVYGVVNQSNAENGVVSLMLLNLVDRVISDIDWVSSKTIGCKGSSECDKTEACQILSQRLTHLLQVLNPLTNVVQKGADIFKSLKKVFDLAGKITKQQLITLKKDAVDLTVTGQQLHEQLIQLIESTHAAIDASYADIQELHEKDKTKKDSKGQKSKSKAKAKAGAAAAKMSKNVPDAVCAIEEYQTGLIALNKESRCRLLKNFKRSVVRDFKINQAQAQQLMADAAEADEEDSDSQMTGIDDSEDGDGHTSKRKRSKSKSASSKKVRVAEGSA